MQPAVSTPAEMPSLPLEHQTHFTRLSVVIPVYNEVVHIGEILRHIHTVAIPKEIIIVDDGSTDGTREYLASLEKNSSSVFIENGTPTSLKIVFHKTNQGKGASVRTGIAHATGQITIIQDADLEYDPRDYFKMITPILNGSADVVYGSRFRGETARVHFFWHALGNKALTLFSNILTDLNLTDMETCYKAFKTDVIKTIPLRSNRFGFEPEITAKVAKLRCRIYEVAISYQGRSYEEGKKITWKDGLQAIFTILRYWIVDDLYDKTAGLRTLRIMEGAGSYNRWLFQQCAPYLGKRVLEVGAGVGNITKYLLDRPSVVVTDFSETYVDELRDKYRHLPNLRCSVLDLVSSESVNKLKKEIDIDTILSMNMLEHIEDDSTAVTHMHDLLNKGGHLVLLVPAHQLLFSNMDRNLDHFRRYDREGLSALLERAGFKIIRASYLNWLGALGWFVNGRILKRNLIPSRQLRLFDLMILLLKIEKWISPPFGLSLLIVAEKP